MDFNFVLNTIHSTIDEYQEDGVGMSLYQALLDSDWPVTDCEDPNDMSLNEDALAIEHLIMARIGLSDGDYSYEGSDETVAEFLNQVKDLLTVEDLEVIYNNRMVTKL